jgi:hypothetical protein
MNETERIEKQNTKRNIHHHLPGENEEIESISNECFTSSETENSGTKPLYVDNTDAKYETLAFPKALYFGLACLPSFVRELRLHCAAHSRMTKFAE